MEVGSPEVQPKKSWVAIAVELGQREGKDDSVLNGQWGSSPKGQAEGEGNSSSQGKERSGSKGSPRRRSELIQRLRSRRRRGAETMLPAIVGAWLKSKRGKENLVGIQRCLQSGSQRC